MGFDNPKFHCKYSRAIADYLHVNVYKWIQLPQDGAVSSPGARQDHACHLVGSNMVIVGGRNGSAVCDNSTGEHMLAPMGHSALYTLTIVLTICSLCVRHI